MPKLIIANWKSNHTLESAQEWVEQMVDLLQEEQVVSNPEVAVAPPLPFLLSLREQLEGLGIKLATQDISTFEAGSYTGEVGAHNLLGLGVQYVLVGHSERRQLFGETHQEVALKAVRVVQAGIKPVICVDKPYFADQLEQLRQEFVEAGLEVASSDLLIAYEPIEAIGSGQGAALEQVRALMQEISTKLPKAKILYGGSVTAANVAEYLAVCDGVLVGGASLQAASFAEIIKQAAQEQSQSE